jgi:hypothetical protein
MTAPVHHAPCTVAESSSGPGSAVRVVARQHAARGSRAELSAAAACLFPGLGLGGSTTGRLMAAELGCIRGNQRILQFTARKCMDTAKCRQPPHSGPLMSSTWHMAWQWPRGRIHVYSCRAFSPFRRLTSYQRQNMFCLWSCFASGLYLSTRPSMKHEAACLLLLPTALSPKPPKGRGFHRPPSAIA